MSVNAVTMARLDVCEAVDAFAELPRVGGGWGRTVFGDADVVMDLPHPGRRPAVGPAGEAHGFDGTSRLPKTRNSRMYVTTAMIPNANGGRVKMADMRSVMLALWFSTPKVIGA